MKKLLSLFIALISLSGCLDTKCDEHCHLNKIAKLRKEDSLAKAKYRKYWQAKYPINKDGFITMDENDKTMIAFETKFKETYKNLLSSYKELFKITPSADYAFKIAQNYFFIREKGTFEEAVKYYKKAIELDPTNIEYYKILSMRYNQYAIYSEAIEYSNKCIDLNGYNNSLKGLCYLIKAESRAYRDGWSNDVEKDFDEAIKYADDREMLWLQIKNRVKNRTLNMKK